MNSGRVLRLELTRDEVDVLTELMCARGCSMEEAARHLIAEHGRPRLPSFKYMREYMREFSNEDRRDYMRDYMRDYRSAMRLGIPVSEYRKRKHTP
jgi:hypothetical protein